MKQSDRFMARDIQKTRQFILGRLMGYDFMDKVDYF
jgi:hypothetical protein